MTTRTPPQTHAHAQLSVPNPLTMQRSLSASSSSPSSSSSATTTSMTTVSSLPLLASSSSSTTAMTGNNSIGSSPTQRLGRHHSAIAAAAAVGHPSSSSSSSSPSTSALNTPSSPKIHSKFFHYQHHHHHPIITRIIAARRWIAFSALLLLVLVSLLSLTSLTFPPHSSRPSTTTDADASSFPPTTSSRMVLSSLRSLTTSSDADDKPATSDDQRPDKRTTHEDLLLDAPRSLQHLPAHHHHDNSASSGIPRVLQFEVLEVELLPYSDHPDDTTGVMRQVTGVYHDGSPFRYPLCTFTSVAATSNYILMSFHNLTVHTFYSLLFDSCTPLYWQADVCRCFHDQYRPGVLPFPFPTTDGERWAARKAAESMLVAEFGGEGQGAKIDWRKAHMFVPIPANASDLEAAADGLYNRPPFKRPPSGAAAVRAPVIADRPRLYPSPFLTNIHAHDFDVVEREASARHAAAGANGTPTKRTKPTDRDSIDDDGQGDGNGDDDNVGNRNSNTSLRTRWPVVANLSSAQPLPRAPIRYQLFGHFWSVHKWVQRHHIAHWAQKLLAMQATYAHQYHACQHAFLRNRFNRTYDSSHFGDKYQFVSVREQVSDLERLRQRTERREADYLSGYTLDYVTERERERDRRAQARSAHWRIRSFVQCLPTIEGLLFHDTNLPLTDHEYTVLQLSLDAAQSWIASFAHDDGDDGGEAVNGVGRGSNGDDDDDDDARSSLLSFLWSLFSGSSDREKSNEVRVGGARRRLMGMDDDEEATKKMQKSDAKVKVNEEEEKKATKTIDDGAKKKKEEEADKKEKKVDNDKKKAAKEKVKDKDDDHDKDDDDEDERIDEELRAEEARDHNAKERTAPVTASPVHSLAMQSSLFPRPFTPVLSTLFSEHLFNRIVDAKNAEGESTRPRPYSFEDGRPFDAVFSLSCFRRLSLSPIYGKFVDNTHDTVFFRSSRDRLHHTIGHRSLNYREVSVPVIQSVPISSLVTASQSQSQSQPQSSPPLPTVEYVPVRASNPDQCAPERAILLKRPDRAILNAPQLLLRLKKEFNLDVEVVDISGANTTRQQVDMFASSGLVLSAHSSQMINVMFSPASAAMIEIAAEFYNADFSNYAVNFGVFFRYALGGRIPDEEKPADPRMAKCLEHVKPCEGENFCVTAKGAEMCTQQSHHPNKHKAFECDIEAVVRAVRQSLVHILRPCYGQWNNVRGL